MNALAPATKLVEEEVLPQYIAKRRWFASKDQTIKSTGISYLVDIGATMRWEVLLTEIEVKKPQAGPRDGSYLWPSFEGRGDLSLAAPSGWRWRGRASRPAAWPTLPTLFALPSVRPPVCYPDP